jgi:oxygen-dependent protoporphyrinogen oxidase
MFPGARAPADHALFQVFLGGFRDAEVCARGDDALIALAREEVSATLGVDGEPAHVRVFRHAVGLPQYEVGHADRIAAIGRAAARHPGLFVAGNAFGGVGIHGRAAQAEDIASRVASWLGGRRSATAEPSAPASLST